MSSQTTRPTSEKTIRVLLKEHTDRIRMTASAHGITVLQNGSSDPICKLARVLLQKGVDPNARLALYRPGGARRVSPSVAWWASKTTTEGTGRSVKIIDYKPYGEEDD